MSSYVNYKNQDLKNASKNYDISSQPKKITTSKEMDEKRRNNIIDWVTFYRRNMHHFCFHYFGIELHFYQKVWMYLMGTRDSFVAIAARASAKTWLLAVFACARAVLYPNSSIVVVSSTKEQAGVIVEEKIKSLYENYPNLAREIKNITTNLNKWQVDFHNGSVIKIVAARDSARGKRSTLTIYEEFRLIDKSVLDSVIRPFAYIRPTPYLKIPEWQDYGEEPKEVFISSAYYRHEWWFNETKKNIRDMLNGHNSGFIAFDCRIAVKHRIKTEKQLRREISKMGAIDALQEYYNIPYGESADSYFKLKQFLRLRSVDQATYPQRNETYNKKTNPYDMKRVDGEIRILVCDLAQRAGKNNDLSINGYLRLIPTHKGYMRELLFMESFSGENSIRQAFRIKRLYHDLDINIIVMDVASGGGGLPIYDQLGQITKDSERGIEYPAMTIMRHNSIDEGEYAELHTRTLGVDAQPVIYPISASAKFNSVMATSMKDTLKKKLFKFLVDEARAEDYLIKTKSTEFMTNDDIPAKAFFMQPYVQTTLMINEAISLSMVLSGGNIKLVEPDTGRKDRIVTAMMGNYYASLEDAVLLKQTDNTSDEESILAVSIVM